MKTATCSTWLLRISTFGPFLSGSRLSTQPDYEPDYLLFRDPSLGQEISSERKSLARERVHCPGAFHVKKVREIGKFRLRSAKSFFGSLTLSQLTPSISHHHHHQHPSHDRNSASHPSSPTDTGGLIRHVSRRTLTTLLHLPAKPFDFTLAAATHSQCVSNTASSVPPPATQAKASLSSVTMPKSSNSANPNATRTSNSNETHANSDGQKPSAKPMAKK